MILEYIPNVKEASLNSISNKMDGNCKLFCTIFDIERYICVGMPIFTQIFIFIYNIFSILKIWIARWCSALNTNKINAVRKTCNVYGVCLNIFIYENADKKKLSMKFSILKLQHSFSNCSQYPFSLKRTSFLLHTRRHDLKLILQKKEYFNLQPPKKTKRVPLLLHIMVWGIFVFLFLVFCIKTLRK